MDRRSLSKISIKIKKLLEHQKELSIRQISIKAKMEWRTAIKSLELMKSLGIVEERKGDSTKRDERLFKLKLKK